jgi:hypothetical protein
MCIGRRLKAIYIPEETEEKPIYVPDWPKPKAEPILIPTPEWVVEKIKMAERVDSDARH